MGAKDSRRTLHKSLEEQAVRHFGHHTLAGGPGRGWGCALSAGQCPCQWATTASAHSPTTGCLRRRRVAGPHVTYCAGHRPRRTQAPPRDVTQLSNCLYVPRLSAFANWPAQQTAPLPPRPRSPGERDWGRGLSQRGGVRRLRAGKGAAWNAV